MKDIPADKSIVLFDGVCNLCNAVVQFIIKHDKKDQFRFVTLQSSVAEHLLKKLNYSPKESSVLLVEDNSIYNKSTAALRIMKRLSGGWKFLSVFLLTPKFIRDKVYEFIAKNRYQWFGRKNECMLPSPELQKKFL